MTCIKMISGDFEVLVNCSISSAAYILSNYSLTVRKLIYFGLNPKRFYLIITFQYTF